MVWQFIAIALAVVAIVVAVLPKPPEQKAPSVTDFEVPTAEEGRPIPVVFGVVTVTGSNVVWYGDIAYQPVRTKSGK